MSIGGGSQQSKTRSKQWDEAQSTSSGSNRSFVDPMQQGFLQNLYGSAMGFANPGATTAAAQGASAAMLPGMRQAFGNIAGLADPRDQIRAQDKSLRAGLGALFTEEMMPAIQSDAISAGGFGGGRQGVAEGVAAGQIADAYTAGMGDITARANQTAVQAASQIPQLAQGLYTAYTAPSLAGLDPLSRLASILGSPTVLSQGQQTAKSSSSAGTASKSDASGWDFKFGLY